MQCHVTSVCWDDTQDAASTGSGAGEQSAAPAAPPAAAAAQSAAVPPVAAVAPPAATVSLPLPADAASLLNPDDIDDAYLWCVASKMRMLGVGYLGDMCAQKVVMLVSIDDASLRLTLVFLLLAARSRRQGPCALRMTFQLNKTCCAIKHAVHHPAHIMS